MKKDKFEEFELVCYTILVPMMSFCTLVSFICYLNGTETLLKVNNNLWITLLLTRILRLLSKESKEK